MNLNDEQKKGLAALYEKIKDVRVAMLTTTDHVSGRLHSRPMDTNKVEEQDGTLWFFCYSNSEKAYEVKQKNKVNLSYADTSHNTYVSISGESEIVEDKARAERLWNPALKIWFPQGLETPHLALMKVTITEGEYWDADKSRMVQIYEVIKGLFKEQEPDLGDHAKITLDK